MPQPQIVSPAEVRAAAARIAPYVVRTPTMSARSLGELSGLRSLELKAELFQRTGSFKVRGVFNALLQLGAAELARGVVALSAGNHAAALAHAATRLGTKAVVVMPAHASRSKIEATRSYGGEVVLTEGSLLDTCRQVQDERGLTLVHPFDDLHVIAGAGTVGLEVVEDTPDVDVVVVPVGGGGLISGVAAALRQSRPHARVIGVEPVGADAMSRALSAGEVVPLARPTSVADGLGAPFAGAHTLAHVQALVEQVVIVTEEEIAAATRLLYQRAKLAAEAAGATGLAALLHRDLVRPEDRVVCIVTGGNIDAPVVARVFGSAGADAG